MDTARTYRQPAAARSTIDSVLHPVNGYRDSLRRRGIKPKDHARDNVRAIRQVQKANRAYMESEHMGPEPFKMKRFAEVKSRVRTDGAPTPSAGPAGGSPGKEDDAGGSPVIPSVKTGTKKFLRKNTRPDPTKEPVRPYRRPEDRVSTKPAVPRAHETATLAPRTETNFLVDNAREAIAAKPMPRGSGEEKAARPADYGRVPKYLEERKAHLAEARERAAVAAGDPDCPPGMRLMPEEERLDTLRVLRDSLDEVKQQIFKMPLVIETAGQVRRKNALEAKAKEIEDAIAIFDRPKVFVQED